MSSITQETYDVQSSFESVMSFFKRYKLGSALNRAGAYKKKGTPISAVMQYLIALVYTAKSMYQDMRSASPLAAGFCKDTVYRFLNQMYVNWQAFLLTVASGVVHEIDRLTSDERRSAYVIDDTMYQVPFAKKTELVSKVHDHAEKGKNKFKWGFRMLTLGWTDGASFIPLAFRHLASSDKKNQRCGPKPGIDRRSCAHRIRVEAVSKATEVMIMHLEAAKKAGIAAKHVLFDTWFAYPATIIHVWALKLHVVARVKDTTKIKYFTDNGMKTAKEIFKENRKRPGKSRYLLSVPIHLYTTIGETYVAVKARIVYVRNRNKRNEWIALVSTDLEMSEEDIIALYGKRWDIEVFFKVCKTYLRLAGEFQQLSYDAITAHTTIVMLRYMMLSIEKRTHEDPRTLGELFYLCFDEASDIKFERALMLIMSLLTETLRDVTMCLSEEHIESILDAFLQKLPSHFQSCLCYSRTA